MAREPDAQAPERATPDESAASHAEEHLDAPVPYALTQLRTLLDSMSSDVERLAHRSIESARVAHPVYAAPVDADAVLTRFRVENAIRDDARRVREALAKLGRSLGYLREITSERVAALTSTDDADNADDANTAAATQRAHSEETVRVHERSFASRDREEKSA